MKEFVTLKEKDVEEKRLSVGDMTFSNLRDCLIGLGTILDEDFNLNSYVMSVPAGVANRNTSVVAIQFMENELCILGYAPEGLINQHTAKKAIDKVEKRVSMYINYKNSDK